MQRDESGDAPDTRPDEELVAPSDWTVEDFDNFAPFDADDEAVEPPQVPASDESPQGTLEFGFAADESPVDPDEGDVPAEAPDEEIPAIDDTPNLDEPSAIDEEVSEVAGFEQFASRGEEGADDDGVAPLPSVPEIAPEDTLEVAFEGGEAATAAPSEDEDAVEVPDFASFTSDQYVQTTTQEFVDLAEEMALASATEHQQSAVSAEIPGLESGLIGLEDVVAASGADPAAIPVAQRSNLASRVFTGLALAIIFFASLVDPLFIGLFVLVVLFLSAGEFYSALMRAGHRPLGLFGLLGALGALAGTWVWGLIAVPIAIAATLVATLLFFSMVSERRDPMTSTGLTVLGMAWVGGMGAFILDMVQYDNYGWLIVAVVLSVALMDIASFFVGRRLGRHRMAPRVSPKKTVEGLIGGMLVAVLVGVAFGLREPFDLGSGLALGAVVAVAAPLGDLAVSVMKRSIGVKDMGTLLPGHGGFLDRIDAMLFVIPLAWIVFSWTGLLT